MFQLPAAGIVRTAGFNVHVAPLSLIERRPLISGLVGPVAARLDYPAMNKVPHKIRNVGLAVALRQRLAQRYRQCSGVKNRPSREAGLARDLLN